MIQDFNSISQGFNGITVAYTCAIDFKKHNFKNVMTFQDFFKKMSKKRLQPECRKKRGAQVAL